jgi:hypothetical protein
MSGSSAAKRARKEEHLRALVETTDPAALARYAGELRPIVAGLRAFAEDATAPRPVFSREHAREQLLKSLRAIEDRIDAAAPEHGDPAGLGGAGPVA